MVTRDKAHGQAGVNAGTGKEKEDSVEVHKKNYLEKVGTTKRGKNYCLIRTGKRKGIKVREIDDKERSEKTVQPR